MRGCSFTQTMARSFDTANAETAHHDSARIRPVFLCLFAPIVGATDDLIGSVRSATG